MSFERPSSCDRHEKCSHLFPDIATNDALNIVLRGEHMDIDIHEGNQRSFTNVSKELAKTLYKASGQSIPYYVVIVNCQDMAKAELRWDADFESAISEQAIGRMRCTDMKFVSTAFLRDEDAIQPNGSQEHNFCWCEFRVVCTRKILKCRARSRDALKNWVAALDVLIEQARESVGIQRGVSNIFLSLTRNLLGGSADEHRKDRVKARIRELVSTKLNYPVCEELVEKMLAALEMRGSDPTNTHEFAEVLQLFNVKSSLSPLFDKYALPGLGPHPTRYLMSAQKFQDFLEKEQREQRALEVIHALFESLGEPLVEQVRDEYLLTEAGFSHVICCKDNSLFHPWRRAHVHQDMTRPMSHYWISSSHNTYLEGHQWIGESSLNQYIDVLMSGCRCIEIDCWNGDDGEPMVTHGWTMTSKLLFRDVVRTCRDYGFIATPYPLIFSLEVHCNPQQRKRMAEILRETLGSMLLLHPGFDEFETADVPSPQEAKCKIIIKAKVKISRGRTKVASKNLLGQAAEEASNVSHDVVQTRIPEACSSPPDAAKPTSRWTFCGLCGFRPKLKSIEPSNAKDCERSDCSTQESLSMLLTQGTSAPAKPKLTRQSSNVSHESRLSRQSSRSSAGSRSNASWQSSRSNGSRDSPRSPAGSPLPISPTDRSDNTGKSGGRLNAFRRSLSFNSNASEDSFREGSGKRGSRSGKLRRSSSFNSNTSQDSPQSHENFTSQDSSPSHENSGKRGARSGRLRKSTSFNSNTSQNSSHDDLANRAAGTPSMRGFLQRSATSTSIASHDSAQRSPKATKSLSSRGLLRKSISFTSTTSHDSPRDTLAKRGRDLLRRSVSFNSNASKDTAALSTLEDRMCRAFAMNALYATTIFLPTTKFPKKCLQPPTNLLHTCSCTSFNERKAVRFIKKFGFKQLQLHHAERISRVYPAASRVTSGNFDPMPLWLAGFQMVALNYQTMDRHMVLNAGLFMNENGGCGYVLKPTSTLGDAMSEGDSPLSDGCIKSRSDAIDARRFKKGTLELRILSAHYLPRPEKLLHEESINPSVNVTLAGFSKDATTIQTRTVQNNGFNPSWNERFVFELERPALAILKFEILHIPSKSSDSQVVAAAALPLSGLREGVRWISLFDQGLHGIELCGLLVEARLRGPWADVRRAQLLKEQGDLPPDLEPARRKQARRPASKIQRKSLNGNSAESESFDAPTAIYFDETPGRLSDIAAPWGPWGPWGPSGPWGSRGLPRLRILTFCT